MKADASGETPPAPPGPISFALTLAKPYRHLIVATMGAAALSAAFSLVPLVAIAELAARMLDNTAAPSHVSAPMALAVIATAAQLLCAAAANRWGHSAAFAVQRDVRLRLIDSIDRAPLSRVEGRAGEMKKIAMGDVDRLEGLLAHVIPDLVAGLTAPILGGLILVFIDWRLVLAAAAMLPIAAAAQAWTYRGRTDLYQQWNEAEAAANTTLLSYVRGIATLRAFNRQASTLASVLQSIEALRDLAVLITRRSSYPYALFGSALSANLVVVLPVVMVLHMGGAIDLGESVLAVLVGSGLLAPLNKAVFATQIAARTGVAIDRIRQELDAPPLREAPVATLTASNHLRLDRVSFVYPDGREALHEISCEIPEGALTALVGPSGAGKSTLARLLLRLDDCTSGRITLGGVDIRDLPVEALRSRLAAVFQDAILFAGSIADNVAMAAPAGASSRVADALEAAQADRIGGDPAHTLALPVGDRGAQVSGGEKQRIAIARAIAKDTPILVLDEPTAHVDANSESKVQKALAEASRGRTVIVVAHWIQSIRNASQIIVLNAGHIEATGTHASLMSSSPTYRTLVEAQEKAIGWTLAARTTEVMSAPC